MLVRTKATQFDKNQPTMHERHMLVRADANNWNSRFTDTEISTTNC